MTLRASGACLLMLVGVATSLRAEVALTMTTPAALQTPPRSRVTTAYVVRNTGTSPQQVRLTAAIPEGWRTLVAAPADLELLAGASTLVVIAVWVPQSAVAGGYEIALTGDELSATTRIEVLPRIRLSARLLRAPPAIIAGDSYEALFAIANEGDLPTNVGVTLQSTELYAVSADVGPSFQLQPGASRTIAVAVETDGTRLGIISHHLTLTARSRAQPDVFARARSEVEVIPILGSGGQRFNRLPMVAVASQSTGLDEDGTWVIGGSIAAQGRGAIDQDGAHRVELAIAKSVDTEQSAFAHPDDNYRLRYETRTFGVDLGDNRFALSPLVAGARLATGIGGWLDVAGVDAGAFYYGDSTGSAEVVAPLQPDRHVLGAHAGYAIQGIAALPGTYGLRIDGLRIDEGVPKHLLGYTASATPAANLEIVVEQAWSLDGEAGCCPMAIAGGVETAMFGVDATAEVLHAMAGFEGTAENQSRIAVELEWATLDLPISLDASFRRTRSNVTLNDPAAAAPVAHDGALGVKYAVPNGQTSIGGQVRIAERHDLLQPDVGNDAGIFAMSLEQAFDRADLNVSVELGYGNATPVRAASALLVGAAVRGSLRPSEELSFGASLAFDGDVPLVSELAPGGAVTARVDGSWQTKQLTAEAGLQSETGGEGGVLARHGLSVSGSYDFGAAGQVSADTALAFAQSSEGWTPTFDLNISYQLPFELPTLPKRGVANVSGTIIDAATRAPVGDVIVKTGRLGAVTDPRGQFLFRGLSPGTHYLTVDARSLDGLVVTVPVPITVEVSGRNQSLTIPVAAAATLTGSVLWLHLPLNRKRRQLLVSRLQA